MVDAVEETEGEFYSRVNENWWYSLNANRVRPVVDPVQEVGRLACNDWVETYEITSETPEPRLIKEI